MQALSEDFYELSVVYDLPDDSLNAQHATDIKGTELDGPNLDEAH